MKRNKTNLKSFLLFIPFFVVFLTSCDYEDVANTEPEPEPDPPADTAEAVAPDGILETVTWNIEWYGSFTRGPTDEDLQTANVIKIVDSLKADLYAFQEISDRNALEKITARMKGYEGIIAEHVSYNQKMAFVYNIQTIEPVSSGPITENQDDYQWADRLPFYFAFNYTYDTVTMPVYAVVIHAKANTGETSEERTEAYQRRQQAAQSLHEFLINNKPSAHIVFLGDYNDDVDVSVYEEKETPYQTFVTDNDDFLVVTRTLSAEEISSTVRYDNMVDHITVSNEMEPFYVPGSENRFKPTNDFIEDYGQTTSDHYPVIAKFDIRQ